MCGRGSPYGEMPSRSLAALRYLTRTLRVLGAEASRAVISPTGCPSRTAYFLSEASCFRFRAKWRAKPCRYCTMPIPPPVVPATPLAARPSRTDFPLTAAVFASPPKAQHSRAMGALRHPTYGRVSHSHAGIPPARHISD